MMIKPHKYMDIKTSVISICAVILYNLKDVNVTKYNDMLNIIQRKLGDNAKYNYIYALELLYVLGKIEYDPNTDSLELII